MTWAEKPQAPASRGKIRTTWKVPLFNEEKNEHFEWTVDWMQLFERVNPNRKGTKSAVSVRMKRFFAENPHVRKDDVFEATRRYISTVSDPQFLKSSHKFIYEGSGFKQVSLLKQYVDMVLEKPKESGRSNRMMN